jgi:Domain of unknown function (DUF4041)/Meiotically up-regulated gene 113/Protein of unknown function (DUF2510)
MTPPGWYSDPQNQALVRWWNGEAWTEHTKLVGATPSPPLVQQPPSHQVAPNPAGMHLAQGPVDLIHQQIQAAEARLNAIRGELESVEESIEIQSFGFYRPRYGFQSSDKYSEHLKVIREQQKSLIKSGEATFCDTKWVVSGSEAEGRKMIQRLAKLMLRAFNGECDAAIAKARYDNVVMLEQRITKSCEEVNKLGHSNRITITPNYYELKLAELHLVHEHREKVQEEKEEQRQIREQMRDDQKARDEIERAQAEAEQEEQRYEKALAKARADLDQATDKQHDRLEALVTKLETELKDAIDRKAKAIARAQLTKSGHVYVLSNIGSFGEGVYKIGLTRRLDPLERIDELGSASVPFAFDVHAIIYSADAPALEHALHKEFFERRVNLVNHRKEYFRVSLEDIRVAVEKHHGLVSFVLTPEAEEWRKTRSIIEAPPP